MSSLWGSTFRDTKDETSNKKASEKDEDYKVDIGNVLAFVHRSLPQIDRDLLKADKPLGSGSVFQVHREIYDEKVEPPVQYFVATKYMRMEKHPEKNRKILHAILRELRVLTHPLLRSHPHIISVFGYGWNRLESENMTPFLVVPYAEFGTLSELLKAYKQQRHVTVLERHDLALDVAVGLKALHECGFVHGDVKADNVLVCTRSEPLGYTFGDDQIPWVAKIADFGCSFTRKEVDDGIARYTGTTVYNAPEIEGFCSENSSIDTFEAYQRADAYSFGLLIWEVMNDGFFYLDSLGDDDELLKTKRWQDYLTKKYEEPREALLEMALQFIRETQSDSTFQAMFQSIEDALRACLRKVPSQRAHIADAVAILEIAARNDRQPIVYSIPRLKSGPYREPLRGNRIQHRYVPMEIVGYTGLADMFWPLRLKNQEASGFTFSKYDGACPASENRLIPYHRHDSRDMQTEPDDKPQTFSLQRAVLSPRPPWKIQQGLGDQWQQQIEEEHDTVRVSEACFELSICYHLGFGVEPDQKQAASLLRQALYGNAVAKAIGARVTAALSHCSGSQQISEARQSYLSDRIRSLPFRTIQSTTKTELVQLSPRPQLKQHPRKIQEIIDVVKAGSEVLSPSDKLDLAKLEELWAQHIRQHSVPWEGLSQRDLCNALTQACRRGLFEAATILARLCLSYLGKLGEATPLHWLIMFPGAQAEAMLALLVHGTRHNGKSEPGICFSYLNTRTSYSLFVPEFCMELFGSPLHWAVRSRNLVLVKLLLDAGADPTVRSKVRAPIVGEPPQPISIDYNALDLATEYHLYEIVDEIVTRSRCSESRPKLDIALSLLARTTTPFARYLIHGLSYRTALQKTIQVLTSFAYNLEGSDRFGSVPVLVALEANAQENYIIEELLHSTPNLRDLQLSDGQNLASMIVQSAEADYPSTAWRLQQVLPLVQDINATDDNGYNALHYCALVDNSSMTGLLLKHKDIESDSCSKNKYQHTALMLAAQFGRTEIVRLLLTTGVKQDIQDFEGSTALELAVSNRQLDTASLLIESGASIEFRIHNGIPQNTVLHNACIQATNRLPLTKDLLERHSRLRDRSALDRFCGSTGRLVWTPLYNAVYYADLESASALLQHGADPTNWNVRQSVKDDDPLCYSMYKLTPLDLVGRILMKAASNHLDLHQLKVARQGQANLMKDIRFLSEEGKRKDRLEREYFEGTTQFDFRLEDIQTQKNGLAGVRNFVARLKEIKRLMEEAAKLQKHQQ